MTKSRIQTSGIMLATAAFCAMFLTACGGKSPSSAADTYLGNLKLYNYPALYQSMSHQDQLDRTMDQFLLAVPMAPDVNKDWFKGMVRAYDYKIGEAKIDGNNANVIVNVTRPDLELWERTVDASLTGDQTPDGVAQKNLE